LIDPGIGQHKTQPMPHDQHPAPHPHHPVCFRQDQLDQPRILVAARGQILRRK